CFSRTLEHMPDDLRFAQGAMTTPAHGRKALARGQLIDWSAEPDRKQVVCRPRNPGYRKKITVPYELHVWALTLEISRAAKRLRLD
ncbi:hypothetical protein, partial [Pantoea dispersa]|uniref:hypothetical protein n=1 Tax=Pantoea dispersa TaxID=59814 RepID=UPI001C657F5B